MSRLSRPRPARRSPARRKLRMSTAQIPTTFSIVLAMICLPAVAASHCPDGGECFTEERARERIQQECSEAMAKWRSCRSELVDCNSIEAELNKCRGRLQESQRDSQRRARTIRHLDRTRGHSTWTVVGWTIGGITVGVPVGVLLATSLGGPS